MKDFKLGSCLAFIVATSLASAGVVASDKETERQVLVEDRYGGQHQVTQKVYEHGDGFYTFVRNARPEKLRNIHQDICQSVGGVDVFDKGTTMVSQGVLDVAICKITDRKAIDRITTANPGKQFSAGEPADQKTEMITANSGLYWPPALNLIPPNRDVPVNINYRLNGYVEYYTKDGGFYHNSMQADKCGISRSGTIGSDARGMLYINVLCVSHNAGTWPVYLSSTIPGLSATAVGEIRAQ
ncbi:hypothetical protein [Marinobacter oulmenensis]|uniref:Uncharacterized protein n=1 Tax=Marinobacter oulmenensis TaxID=643747 RepID=A0A840ULD8_9GAMM|nr:hypothetical protein [Marinobacter oulmenensis]MBB5321896.1 hypothetical protein [Marinobacter oulmenensis]